MRPKQTPTHNPSTATLYADELARHAGEHTAISPTLEHELRLQLLDQADAGDVAAARAVASDPGYWIHLGCGGVLTRLQGITRPICTRCGKEVR